MNDSKIIDGKKISSVILEEISETINRNNIKPGLAVIFIGDNPASQIYVRKKKEAAEKIGIKSLIYELNKDISEKELFQLLEKLNNDDSMHGIIVQLPVPAHLDKDKIIETINPLKDVDGFHPYNVGKLMAGLKTIESCTPKGIMELLKRYDVDLCGKRAVIVGRSNIVGKPLVPLFLRENATPTICHSKTKNLKEICREADILVAAIGQAEMITREYVKEGAVIIDVGMNRLNGKLTGDVNFNSVIDKVSLITPVPGGVGPMTVTMLLKNTLELALNNK